MKRPPLTWPYLVLPFIFGIGMVSTSTILNDGFGFFDSLWPSIPAMCLISFPLIEWQAIVHARKIRYAISPRHFFAGLLRGTVSLAIACLIHAYYFVPVKILWLMIFSAFWFGLIFNWQINHYLGKHPLYIGKNALVDKLFRKLGKHGGKWLIGFEIIGMAISAWFYIS